jgi:phospholipid/cholesterol/gamma-HCH transport system substrate-binding protein
MTSKRLVRERRRSTVAGIIVILTFAAMLVVAFRAANGLPGQKHESVKVAFTEVGALREGDDVRFSGLRVGTVRHIALVDGHPVVTLSLQGGRAVYRDARAAIAQRSALGQAYVDISPGTAAAGRLGEDEVIRSGSAQSAQDLSAVLDVFDPGTRQSLRTLVSEVGNGARGHAVDVREALSALPQALPDLERVSAALSRDDGRAVTELLSNASGLARSFAGRQQDLRELITQLGVTLDAVGVDDGRALGNTLRQAPETLRSVAHGLAALEQPLRATESAVTALRPGARSLGAATPALRAVLRDGVRPLRKVPSVMDQAERPVGELTGLLRDARPLAPEAARAIQMASTPLAVLAPYAPEMSRFFTYATSVLGESDDAGHWLRMYLVFSTESVSGILPIRDPLTSRNAYPAPGQAEGERESTILGTRR